MGQRRSGAWRIATAWEARAAWQALAPGDRAVLEALLAGIASTLGLRQWVSEEEAEEEFSLRAPGHEVTYRLEPSTRVLWVTGVNPLRPGGVPRA
ncbi:hypothetical protein JY651_46590 [Pyxidicoccus parkwayensis]|uniref:Uncharacterized protein n=1 Tax=Pyxidicoccus parkwayensis TaxID=2813578 RepID=A0ABX7NYM9_9BACT|nr:hypothetical protein [Pyxidicoccus parkwaysis]QSQ22504.1 hypothetical protein JY651_46590 [Pyxidicoccus parkwaysis]